MPVTRPTSATVTAVVVAAIALTARVARADGDRAAVQWVRLCASTGDGGSRLNVTMPCGVRVQDAVVEQPPNGERGVEQPPNGEHGVEQPPNGQRGVEQPPNGDRGVEQPPNGERGVEQPPNGDRGIEQPSNGERGVEWVRLCASTGDGGSRLNVTMPCGVRVQDAVVEQPSNGERDVEQPPNGERGVEQPPNGERDVEQPPNGERGVEQPPNGERGVEQPPNGETDGGPDPEDEDVDVVVDDDDHDDDLGDGHYDDHYDEDGRDAIEKRRGDAATKLIFAYLLDARNRLHDKIHDLLDRLRRAFFDAQLSRRIRRDTARKRPAHDVSTARRADKNKKPSITSMIMKPTFERSMMTMSFLMFGVFVIRVVQRLVQTLQHPGEISSTLPGGILPAALSGLF